MSTAPGYTEAVPPLKIGDQIYAQLSKGSWPRSSPLAANHVQMGNGHTFCLNCYFLKIHNADASTPKQQAAYSSTRGSPSCSHQTCFTSWGYCHQIWMCGEVPMQDEREERCQYQLTSTCRHLEVTRPALKLRYQFSTITYMGMSEMSNSCDMNFI